MVALLAGTCNNSRRGLINPLAHLFQVCQCLLFGSAAKVTTGLVILLHALVCGIHLLGVDSGRLLRATGTFQSLFPHIKQIRGLFHAAELGLNRSALYKIQGGLSSFFPEDSGQFFFCSELEFLSIFLRGRSFCVGLKVPGQGIRTKFSIGRDHTFGRGHLLGFFFGKVALTCQFKPAAKVGTEALVTETFDIVAIYDQVLDEVLSCSLISVHLCRRLHTDEPVVGYILLFQDVTMSSGPFFVGTGVFAVLLSGLSFIVGHGL